MRDLVIGGLDEAYEVIGRAALVAVFGGEADDVAVFLGEHAGEAVPVDVAVYPGEELGLLAGVRVEAEEALALVVAEVVVPAEGVDAVDAPVEVHLVIDELAGLGVHGEELDLAVVVDVAERGGGAVREAHQAHEAVHALALGDAVEQLALEADAQQLAAHVRADAAVAVDGYAVQVEIAAAVRVLVELGEVDGRGLVALGVEDAQQVLFDIGGLLRLRGRLGVHGEGHGLEVAAGGRAGLPAAGGVADVLGHYEPAVRGGGEGADPGPALRALGYRGGRVAADSLEVAAVGVHGEEGRHIVGICILLHDGLAVLVEDGVAVFVTAGVALGDLAVLDAGHEVDASAGEAGVVHALKLALELGVLGHIGEFRRGGVGGSAFAAACGEQAQGQHKRQDEAAGLFHFHRLCPPI